MEHLTYRIENRLYLNICNRCTLQCWFCPKNQGKEAIPGLDLSLRKSPTAETVIEAIQNPRMHEEIVFCGLGEPTLRLSVLIEVAKYLRLHKTRVRVNTDGLANLIYKRNILPEIAPFVDAVSVSLNAQNETLYKQHCKPKLAGAYAAVICFLAQARQHISEVTATAVEGLLGVDIDACANMAHQLGVSFRKRTLGVIGRSCN